ncbi:MAG: hypothetical protein QM749_15920 [Aquabacterium sp.]
MSDDFKKLFTIQSSIDACTDAVKFIKSSATEDDHTEFMLTSLSAILDDITKRPEKYDENCQANINWIGDRFVNAIREISGSSAIHLDVIEYTFIYAFRFLCEFDFNEDIDMFSPLYRIRNDTFERLSSFSTNMQSQIVYAGYAMPAQVVKTLIKHENISSVKAFAENLSKYEKARNDSENELNAHTARVQTLKNQLDEYQQAFNFVALNKGFGNLTCPLQPYHSIEKRSKGLQVN